MVGGMTLRSSATRIAGGRAGGLAVVIRETGLVIRAVIIFGTFSFDAFYIRIAKVTDWARTRSRFSSKQDFLFANCCLSTRIWNTWVLDYNLLAQDFWIACEVEGTETESLMASSFAFGIRSTSFRIANFLTSQADTFLVYRTVTCFCALSIASDVGIP